MTKPELKKILREKPGYLKSGSKKLAALFGVSRKIAKQAVYEVHKENKYPTHKFKRLFFDIETSPNIGVFWRSGWKQTIPTSNILEERRVITVSWKWEHEDKVYHLNWDNNKCDKELLESFTSVLGSAHEVVTHNGDRFDIPWLRTRCIKHGLPFPTYVKSLDTLKKVRSMFNFQSNKLNYIANFLGLGGKEETGGFDLWLTLLLKDSGSSEYKDSLKVMHKYCDHDVVLLEDVYHKIQQYIKPVTHVGIYQGKGKFSCSTCGETNLIYKEHTVTTTGIIKRHMECPACHSDFIINNKVFLNNIK